MADAFDCIVIGGGHNGLVCAAHLAAAGRRTAVIEARPLLGGYTTSERPFPDHPDVQVSMASMDLATANLPPSVIDELALRDHGLELIDVDPFYSYVAPDGTSLAFWRDVERTCGEIARVSHADAHAYRELTRDMTAFWRTVAPYMHAHPARPGVGPVARMALRALGEPKRLARAGRMMMMSPRALLVSLFESEAMRAALANFAAASAAPLDQPGSGIILAIMAMQHAWGVTRPVGGMGGFAAALEAAGRRHGVTFMTGSPVRSIRMDGERVSGVVLQDGRTFAARDIIGAIDPTTLMTRLLPSGNLPARTRSELAGLGVFAGNIASARVDLLLRRTPSTTVDARRAADLLPSSMLIGPSTLEAVQAYVAGCSQGRLGEAVPVWAASPLMLDRSLTPTGDQQTLYVYVPAVPLRLAGGQPWSERREDLGDKVLRRLETVMPGLPALVLARSVRTPEDLEATSELEKGCMYHVDMSLSQMGPWRPTPSLAGYATPVKGLWHTGAGAHPLGSVNGIAGKLAARALVRANSRAG